MTIEPIDSNSDRTNSMFEVKVENRFCAQVDPIESLVHFFNEMIQLQQNAQMKSLQASYEYLKLLKLGKHTRRD